ncbi:hypothetical protein [Dolichospermum sp. UHCC 0259]|nr:hypothetical protein [Dolichospermum sp. UHCC 0259]
MNRNSSSNNNSDFHNPRSLALQLKRYPNSDRPKIAIHSNCDRQ